MDELEQARADVAKRREGLRKVEEELKAALVEQEELEPKGLFGLFASAPDPERVAELAAVVEVLKEEHRLRRQAFRQAHAAMEQLESNTLRGAVMPAGIDDLEGAVVAVQALRALDEPLRKLRSIAARAEQARDAVPTTRRSRRGRWHEPSLSAKKTTASVQHADEWEPLADHAELLADAAGFPLVLPRRWDPEARPDAAPQPAADVALARKAAVSRDLEAFGIALSFASSDVDTQARKAWNMLAAIEEGFPEAGGLASERPFDPMQVRRSAAPEAQLDPVHALSEHWEGLRSAHDSLENLAVRGARTVDFLDPMAAWQRHAKSVAALSVAKEHQLLPPVNDGGDLAAFVKHVLSAWPELDSRYRYMTGGR